MHPGPPDPLVISLGAIDPARSDLVGGKAANLCRLLRGGFPVPGGFCITTRAYELAATGDELGRAIGTIAAAGPSDPLDPLAAAARNALMSRPLPASLERLIQDAYADLGKGAALPVAVRSSATAEDLPSASFAGQQDTYLNIIGADALIAAVRSCWASLWSNRAVAYRRSHRVQERGALLAVVVQRLVAAKTAGVLFTANPLTGRRGEAVIDAGYGLGEALVSGEVNPDHFVIDSAAEMIRERSLGSKAIIVRPAVEGGTRKDAVPHGDAAPCLTDAQVLELVRHGKRIEALFGTEQDIEWVIDETGAVWIVQARAITTLYPLPRGAAAHPGETRLYYSINASQGMEGPFTPMGGALFRLLVSSGSTLFGYPPADREAGPAYLGAAGGRLFLDVTPALRNALGRGIILRLVGSAEARAGAALAALADDPRFSLRTSARGTFLRRGLSFFIRAHLGRYMLQSFFHPAGTVARISHLRRWLEGRADAGASGDPHEALAAVERMFSTATIRRLFGIMPPVLLPGLAFTGLAARLLRGLATEEEIQEALLALPSNPTTEMDLRLWDLAACARASSDLVKQIGTQPPQELAAAYRSATLPAFFQDALAGFLNRYGHRCASELDGGLPRWAEDPAPLFALMKGFLRPGGRDPRQAFDAGARAAEAMIDELQSRARRRGLPRALLVRFSLKRARALLGQREMPRFYIALLLSQARGLLLPLGARLAGAGLLESADEIFLLTIAEVREALRGNGVPHDLRARRQDYERELQRRDPPALLLSDGTRPEAPPPSAQRVEGRGEIIGVAASRGRVTGRARIVFDPQNARLEPGEILIAPSTDPGWTPLFLIAGGLVMENGGPMAHGAIVARECGIPAVVAAADATVRIAEGQTITVDGTRGIVEL